VRNILCKKEDNFNYVREKWAVEVCNPEEMVSYSAHYETVNLYELLAVSNVLEYHCKRLIYRIEEIGVEMFFCFF
jgi:hypothetical protein